MPQDLSRPVAWLALLLGAAAAGKAFLSGDPAPGPVDPAGAKPRLAGIEDRVARLEAGAGGPELFAPPQGPGLPALEAGLARLTARVTALEAAARTGPEDSQPPVGLQDLGEAELLARARSLSQSGADAAARAPDALKAWAEVLRRAVSDEVRREALMATGFAHRALKQHDREEAAYREVIASPGAGPEDVQRAEYQIAWSQRFRGDVRSARESMATLARRGHGTRELAGHARLYEADWSLELEDAAAARQALEKIVREFGTSVAPGAAWLAEQATQRLRRLDGR